MDPHFVESQTTAMAPESNVLIIVSPCHIPEGTRHPLGDAHGQWEEALAGEWIARTLRNVTFACIGDPLSSAFSEACPSQAKRHYQNPNQQSRKFLNIRITAMIARISMAAQEDSGSSAAKILDNENDLAQCAGNSAKVIFRCTGCGYSDHADLNAAKILLLRGTTPVETTGAARRGYAAVRRPMKRERGVAKHPPQGCLL